MERKSSKRAARTGSRIQTAVSELVNGEEMKTVLIHMDSGLPSFRVPPGVTVEKVDFDIDGCAEGLCDGDNCDVTEGDHFHSLMQGPYDEITPIPLTVTPKESARAKQKRRHQNGVKSGPMRYRSMGSVLAMPELPS